MPLSYLIDENLRGTLMIALIRVCTRYGLALDVIQVGDDGDPTLGTLDPDLLIWAETDNRILISRDRRTLGGHLADHLNTGHESPGIFIPRNESLTTIAEFLSLAAFASDPFEWKNQITYVP
jgi:hypothetical protein